MTGTTLQQHPLSAAFPSMPEQELGALALDIETHGQREPGVLFEGMVLDGWHRYQACEKAGVSFRSVDFDGEDPVAFVLSVNLHRRHLTASQRALIAQELATRQQGRPQKTGNVAGFSQAEAAKALQVSERSVREAKRVAEEAPDLVADIKAGKTTVAAASREIDKRAGNEPKPKVIKAPRDIEKVYEACKAELVETKDKLSDLADVARELNDKLEVFETTEPDAQQKLIADLQLKMRQKDAEIERLRVQIRDANNKNNELIRTVKRLQKRAGVGQ